MEKQGHVVQSKDCVVIGHRGTIYEELENTLEGFQRCLDMGCDAVELDVFLLKDGTLICFHGGGDDKNPGDLSDYCLDQVGRGILDCDTYTDVLELQFNPKCDEFVCPEERFTKKLKIPTLKEVLELVQGTSMKLTIELKGPGVTRPVLELVRQMGMESQCTYSSFQHDRIKLVRDLYPEYKTGALFDAPVPTDFVQHAIAVGASEVHLRYDTCTPDRINEIHEAGMDSMAWLRGPLAMSDINYSDISIEGVSLYATLMETGVQQICCNRPDVLIQYLKNNLCQNRLV